MVEALPNALQGAGEANVLGTAIVDELGRPLMSITFPASNGVLASASMGLLDISSTRDAVAAAAALHAVDPLDAAVQNAQQIGNILTERLWSESAMFHNLYRQGFHDDIDVRDIRSAHSKVLSTLDEMLTRISEAGVGSLPCAPTTSAALKEEVPGKYTAFDPIIMGDHASKTFERRERLRESSSMVSSILIHHA